MVQMSVIEARLSQLGVRISRLYRPEIAELQQLLAEGEEIFSIVPGRYFGGSALLAATDRRLLLIDKKAMFLTVEIMPYDMVAEVDYSAKLLDATVVLYTMNKQHRFVTMRYKHHLRTMATYIQQKMMEMRYSGGNQGAQTYSQNYRAGSYQPLPQAAPAAQPQQFVVPIAQHHHFTPQLVSRAPGKVKQLVGAAALNGSSRLPRVNPYTQTAFTLKNQYSRFS